MQHFDIRTLSLLAMLSGLLLALGMHLLDRITRDNPAVRAWRLGAYQSALGFTLIALRGVVPDLLSIVLGNTLIVIGMVWGYFGLRLCLGLARGMRWDILAGLLMAATFLYYTYADPSLSARILIFSALGAALNLLAAHLLLLSGAVRGDVDRRTFYLIGLAFLATGLLFALRIGLTPPYPQGLSLMQLTGGIHKLAFVAAITLNIALTIGLTFVMASRTDLNLRNSEEKLRTALNFSPNAIFMVGADGRFTYANRQAESLLGYDGEALLHLGIMDTLPAEELESAMAAFQRNLAGNHEFFETTLLRKDGSRVSVEINGVLLPDGNVLGEVCDITQRKAAEAQVRRLLHEQQVILDNAIVSIVKVRDRTIVWANRGYENMFGYGPGELDGASSRQLYLDQAEYEELGARAYPVLQAGGHFRGESRFRRKDGQIIWTDISSAVLDKEKGETLWAFSDITERKRAEDEIRHLAYFDPLTHLPNRRLLMDRLGHALIASKRSREFGALMILDLDHFKRLNDTQGHDIGDRLLLAVAQRLTACVRQEDTVSRLGGDEYVVMLEGLGQSERTAAAQAEGVAEKISLALTQPYVLGGGEAEYFSTTSIGLTLFHGENDSAEVLLKQADVALYQAKDAGRNAVRFFSPAMQSAIESRIALEQALRRGLDASEFRLYYQPQVDHDGRLIGAETLIRWLPPEQGPVLPAQFIPLAEESGLILRIGQWVLDTACAQIKLWERDPLARDLQLSVNVSARQFHQADFVEQVRQSLLASGANPARLILELTEGVVLDDVEVVIQRMRQLDALGVGFALDDFGTGYSSLSYLKRLPLDQLKIDQSFVRDVTRDANDAAIVRAILAMSRSLGLQAIAEGVETRAQRDFLFENGCTAFQGYLFGRPVPIEEWKASP